MSADYLAFDIGCIECGEPSGIIGFFTSEEGAWAACDAAAERQREDWHGQHHMAVFHVREDISKYADVGV